MPRRRRRAVGWRCKLCDAAGVEPDTPAAIAAFHDHTARTHTTRPRFPVGNTRPDRDKPARTGQ